MIFNGKASQN